jgi:hypothetical protein
VLPAYICTACLTSISGHPDPKPGRKAFSSATPHQARRGKGATQNIRRVAQPISRSRKALDELKQALQAEDQDSTREIPSTSETAQENAAPAKPSKIAKSLEGELSQASANHDEPLDPSAGEKSTKKATPKGTKNKTRAKPEESKITKKPPGKKTKGSKPPKAAVDTPSRKGGLPPSKVRLVRTKSEGPRYADAIKAQIIQIIEDGKLSPSDRVKAVQTLRASLVRRALSKESPKTRKPRNEMGIKEGMLQKPSKASGRGPRTNARGMWGGLATPQPVKTGPMVGKPGFEINSVDAEELLLVPVDKPQPPVPELSYGLERVLFNPGVYHLQDPRSRVFNFDPYLAKIMPVSDFDFNALKQYITSSRDEALLSTARTEGRKYTGSTSSMTAALAHFHFLLSQWRPINTGALSQSFPVQFNSFTALQRGPSAVFLRWKDGVYAIDADKQYDNASVLSMLGKSMEKLLTLPTDDFERYRKENSDQISEEERNEAEAFNYTTIGDFLLRSQLDAYDSRLPGTGMFDLKTRAVVSIRMDTKEYEQGVGYEIKGRHGEYESFEREYYDMIRAAFLKYSLQVRMGRMDGIFVAFHNTARIFGFQYISLSEMDYALHGSTDTTIGDSEFKLSLDLLNRVLDKATAKYPEKSLRLHFETRPSETPFMYIFAEPMEEDKIQAIQETNQAAVLEFERNILGLDGDKTEEEMLEERKNAEWESLRAKVESSMKKDEFDIQEARKFAELMLEESWSLLGEVSAEEKEKLMDKLMATFEGGDDQGIEATAAGEIEDGDDEIEEDDQEIEATAADEVEDADDEMEEDGQEADAAATGEIEDDAETQEEDQEEEQGYDVEQQDGGEAEDGELENGDVEGDRLEDIEAEESENELQDDEHMNEDERAESEVIDNENEEPLSNEEVEADAQPADESTPQEPSHLEQVDAGDTGDKTTPPEDGVLAMTLTIRNKVNGEYIQRPINLNKEDKWTVEYAIADVTDANRARLLYRATKQRRSVALSNEKRSPGNAWNNNYLSKLRQLSDKGREWRENQSKIEEAQGPPKVLGLENTLTAQTEKGQETKGE